MYPEVLREHIQKMQKKQPINLFGVNVPMLYPNIEEIMQILKEEGENCFHFCRKSKILTPFLKKME